MLLQEALERLQDGQPVHREAWSLKDGYLMLMQGMKHVWKIVLEPSPNAGNYIFSLEDLLADDWIEFQMPIEQFGELSEAELADEHN